MTNAGSKQVSRPRSDSVRRRAAGMRQTRAMPDLELRAMTEAEFAAWDDASTREYAKAQVASGVWPADRALEESRRLRHATLPDGLATAGMVFRAAVLPDGTPVGSVWISLTHPRGLPDCAFLFFIEVDEAHRGKGYGRALLAACEDLVAARGIGALELNVFGYNTPAVRLYETSGYSVVTQQMRKTLGATPAGGGGMTA